MPSILVTGISWTARALRTGWTGEEQSASYERLKRDIVDNRAHRTALETFCVYDGLIRQHNSHLGAGLRISTGLAGLAGGSATAWINSFEQCPAVKRDDAVCGGSVGAVITGVAAGFALAEQLGSLWLESSHLGATVREMQSSQNLGILADKKIVSRYGKLWMEDRKALVRAIKEDQDNEEPETVVARDERH